MKWIKQILKGFGIILILFLIFNWNHLVYGIQQLSGQLRLLNNTIPIEEVTGYNVDLIQQIKDFAKDSLGLSAGDAYTSFYDQKGKPVLWVISASSEFKIEPYQWEMSIAGSFPYKGFFVESLANKELLRMKELGYDAEISEVNAWSTLGMFNDPIMSSMLKKSEGSLARLLFHELTHKTIYIKNDISFNENFATVIGDKGGEFYLRTKYGENSKEVKDYVNRIGDYETFAGYMVSSVEELNSFYQDSLSLFSLDEKRSMKRRKINQIICGVSELSFFDKMRYDRVVAIKDSIDNSYFIDFLTYRSKQDSMYSDLNKWNGNLKQYIRFVVDKYDK
jgi:predicted aminopeptidase